MHAVVDILGGVAVVFDTAGAPLYLVRADEDEVSSAKGLNLNMLFQDLSDEEAASYLDHRDDVGEPPFTDLHQELRFMSAVSNAVALTSTIIQDGEDCGDQEIFDMAVEELEEMLADEKVCQRLTEHHQLMATKSPTMAINPRIAEITAPKVLALLAIWPGQVAV